MRKLYFSLHLGVKLVKSGWIWMDGGCDPVGNEWENGGNNHFSVAMSSARSLICFEHMKNLTWSFSLTGLFLRETNSYTP